MPVVLFLAACSAVLTCAGPALLRHVGWGTRHPGVLLALWCATYAAALALAAASLTVALTHALRQTANAGAEPAGVWTGAVTLLFCWAALIGTGALASLVTTRSEPLSADRRRAALLMTALADTCAYQRETRGRASLVYVRSDRPIAVSLPGRRPRVVITSRLAAELTPGQLDAVIEHERTHLAHRHGRLVQFAQLAASCLPTAGTREFHRATRLLVELIADDRAAHRCGRDDLGQALRHLATLTADDGLALRARRTTGRGAPRAPQSPRRPLDGSELAPGASPRR